MVKMVNKFGVSVEFVIVCGTPSIYVTGSYYDNADNIANMDFESYYAYVDSLEDCFRLVLKNIIERDSEPITNSTVLTELVKLVGEEGFKFDFS